MMSNHGNSQNKNTKARLQLAGNGLVARSFVNLPEGGGEDREFKGKSHALRKALAENIQR
jgi:hypothetical protein